MAKRQNIIEDAFRFLKNRCIHCREIIPHNKLFCNKECQVLYFEKMNEIKIGTWTNKKTQSKCRGFKLSNLLNEENLKAMIDETERNIDERMNQSKKQDII